MGEGAKKRTSPLRNRKKKTAHCREAGDPVVEKQKGGGVGGGGLIGDVEKKKKNVRPPKHQPLPPARFHLSSANTPPKNTNQKSRPRRK